MFDFDVSDALVMTAGGIGMAFLVLTLLTVLTSLMGWASQSWSRRASGETSQEEHQARLAAAIAASVAVATSQRGKLPAGGRVSVNRVETASLWAIHGRQDIMESRQGPARRR